MQRLPPAGAGGFSCPQRTRPWRSPGAAWQLGELGPQLLPAKERAAPAPAAGGLPPNTAQCARPSPQAVRRAPDTRSPQHAPAPARGSWRARGRSRGEGLPESAPAARAEGCGCGRRRARGGSCSSRRGSPRSSRAMLRGPPSPRRAAPPGAGPGRGALGPRLVSQPGPMRLPGAHGLSWGDAPCGRAALVRRAVGGAARRSWRLKQLRCHLHLQISWTLS